MKFEEAMKELDELLRQMSGDDVPLEELLAKSQRGAELLKFCRRELGAFERKIEVLLRDDGGGGEWGEMDESAGEAGTASPRRDTALKVKPNGDGETPDGGEAELPF